MEIERDGLGQKAMDFLEGVPAVKSPLRMKYEAETKVFRDQYGGLEKIRLKLGFSRRKMCQLLLVDPSAWTRWSKDESKVPPHVYRSLEWFLALNEKALTQPDLAAVFTNRYRAGQGPESGESARLQSALRDLKAELRRQKQVSALLTAGLLAVALTLLSSWLF